MHSLGVQILIIQKVDAGNASSIVGLLRSDIIRNVFAFYDVQYDLQHTTMHVALEKGRISGYVLVYSATDAPSVILESDIDTAEILVDLVPEDHFVIHAAPEMLPVVQKKYPHAKSYVENWMLVTKNHAKLPDSRLVRRLLTTKDAELLASLILSKEDRPKRGLSKYVEWVNKMPTYGVFKDDELVSYAGSFIQLPEVWMIGGVYTHPDHRNRGYASMATSAVTKKALSRSDAAALFVRSDNYPAIRVYDKIGFRKIGEKLWIDVGTGSRP